MGESERESERVKVFEIGGCGPPETLSATLHLYQSALSQKNKLMLTSGLYILRPNYSNDLCVVVFCKLFRVVFVSNV